ncbi:MAG: hypothetical protein PVF20_04565 [Desulfobacterales bacterium]|jgi:hypothetical protein
MKHIWIAIVAVVILFYTMIGTASAEWIALVMPSRSPISEPLTMVMLGSGLIGAAFFIRKSTIDSQPDDNNPHTKPTKTSA